MTFLLTEEGNKSKSETTIQEPTMQETVEAMATEQQEDQATGNGCICFRHEHQSSETNRLFIFLNSSSAIRLSFPASTLLQLINIIYPEVNLH